MGVSQAPPKWETLRNKPTTVAGFGITDMSTQTVANATNATNITWSGVSGKPTTVEELGLSDFEQKAVNAHVNLTIGAVGTFGQLYHNQSPWVLTLSPGQTVEGSRMRYAAIRNHSTLGIVIGVNSTVPSGTWRCLGNINSTGGTSPAVQDMTLFQRIA